jgi:hypothetical protein
MARDDWSKLLKKPKQAAPQVPFLDGPADPPREDNRIWQEKFRDTGNEWANYLLGPLLPGIEGAASLSNAQGVADYNDSARALTDNLMKGNLGAAAMEAPWTTLGMAGMLVPGLAKGTKMIRGSASANKANRAMIKNLRNFKPAKKTKSAIDSFVDDTPPAGIGHNSNINYYDPLKISKQYPDTGPPSLAKDKTSGEDFLQKELTYEAKAVSKAVKKARDEITAGDYTPFFDVSKRTYVNPKNYPASGRTQTDAVAKKQATRDKWIKEFDTPEARARLQEGYDKAKGDPLAKDWYAVGQLEKEYIKRLGPKAGRAAFGKDFADGMAATTGGANPTANLLMTHYANFMRQAGKPLPKNTYELPYPIGGRYAGTNLNQYDKIINKGEGIAAATNPKRFNFSHNFKGHRDISTLDEQMSGGFKPGMTAPPKGSYGIMEGILADLAQKNNVNPANFQDVGWAGLKGTAGKPMIQQVNEMIHRTSRATGKTPLEVLDGFINKTMPMYSVAPAGFLGAYALSDEESRNSMP